MSEFIVISFIAMIAFALWDAARIARKSRA